MQTANVSVSKDTQYVFSSRAQLIFRQQRTITHRLGGYLNRLETCSGAWALGSLLSSSAGWERTCCPWRPRGSLSSPGTLRTHTQPGDGPAPTAATDTRCQTPGAASYPNSCRKHQQQGKSWYLRFFPRAERRLFRGRAKRRTALLL